MTGDTSIYEKFMKQLPVIPEVATKIMGIAEDGSEISFQELENIIKVDPGLTTKILRVANSAMYARQREIKNLQMAITLLGLKNIKSLVPESGPGQFIRNNHEGPGSPVGIINFLHSGNQFSTNFLYFDP